MPSKNYITSNCTIRSSQITVNDEVGYTSSEINPRDFLKEAYKHYGMAYAKFHKMDDYCKLGFLASEILLKTNNILNTYKKEDIAIILVNSSSSLQTDTEHQATIKDINNYFPSPSLFVYTLPNILIGEIAIRHQMMGENTCFIFKDYNTKFMATYVNSLLNSNMAQCCITGWVDFYENNYEAILYTVEKEATHEATEHTSQYIKN